ncbi:hypothetical protein LCGC14_0403240 [marine sediment metagenome]|uniref:Uncharacterized protein n=1 Tax=marine sediment metagenome TaxID=412755 RepID=A0A0F9TE09_9ZZZZ
MLCRRRAFYVPGGWKMFEGDKMIFEDLTPESTARLLSDLGFEKPEIDHLLEGARMKKNVFVYWDFYKQNITVRSWFY